MRLAVTRDMYRRPSCGKHIIFTDRKYEFDILSTGQYELKKIKIKKKSFRWTVYVVKSVIRNEYEGMTKVENLPVKKPSTAQTPI